MLGAQKKYQYVEAEQYSTALDTKPVIRSKKRSSIRIKPKHKVQIIFTILLASSICLGMLLGYTQLAEAKYKINLLQNDINELEDNIENLKVEVESVQRLDLIEQKAIGELGMQYPQKEQMVFLKPTYQEVATSEKVKKTNPDVQDRLIDEIKDKIQKLILN